MPVSSVRITSAARPTSSRFSFIVAVASAWISPSSSRSAYSSRTEASRRRCAAACSLRGSRCGWPAARSEPRPACGRGRAQQAPFAALAQSVEAFALRVLARRVLGRPQHVQLLPREEVRVLRNDGGRFGALLLAHADGAALLGALERVRAESSLVGVRSGNRRPFPRRGIYTRISSEVAVTYVEATREQYATALDGLWGDLTGALTRLERIAAEPDELDEGTLEVLPVLQYSLHRAGEAIQGIRRSPRVQRPIGSWPPRSRMHGTSPATSRACWRSTTTKAPSSSCTSGAGRSFACDSLAAGSSACRRRCRPSSKTRPRRQRPRLRSYCSRRAPPPSSPAPYSSSGLCGRPGSASSRRRYSCTDRRRCTVSSRPRSSMLSKRPGETFEPVTAIRIG